MIDRQLERKINALIYRPLQRFFVIFRKMKSLQTFVYQALTCF
nr:MAG TPA: hypothetical protein [Caudoviricetes sp.]